MLVRAFVAGFGGVLLVFATVGWLAWHGAQDAEAIAPYTPTLTVKYCNALAADFPSSLPLDDADLAGNPGCTNPVPIAANTARTQTAEWTQPTGNTAAAYPRVFNQAGTVTADAGITDGHKVGGYRHDFSLSLLNGPCATVLTAEAVLYDGNTTSTIATPAYGTSNRYAALVTDGNSDQVADANSALVTGYPDIYEDYFTTSGGVTITPLSRYTGATRVPSGGDWRMVSVLEFSAGQLAPFASDPDDLPSIFGRVSHMPADGTIQVTIENEEPYDFGYISPVHEVCAPTVVKLMLLGQTPQGETRYTTPSAGSTGNAVYSYGFRDADGDTIDNGVDTCPLISNTGTDTDSDGLDNACDPTVAINTGSGDHDGDGYMNRQDNCPVISNGPPPQTEAELAEDLTDTAPDGGPKADGIGDPCDPNPLTASTQGAIVDSYDLAPVCIGAGPDTDGDGYCAQQDVDDGNAAVGGYTLNVGMDQEIATTGGGALRLGDSFGGNTERYLGTNPLKSCGFTAGAPSQSENWPADLVESNSINISDLLALKPVMGGTVPTVSKRFDLLPSKFIDIRDPGTLRRVFNQTCPIATLPPVPVNGTIGAVAIDADVTGNDARLTLGDNIQTCISMPGIGSTAQVDIVAPGSGFSAGDPFAAWYFNFGFNPAVVKVTAQNTAQLITQAGATPILDYSETLPETSGDFISALMDIGSPGAEPGGKDEVGPGVITRLTLEAVGTGLSPLSLNNVTLANSTNGLIVPASVDGAVVRVDGLNCSGDPLPSGGISGMKWEDTNGNGILDGEPPRGGAQICLYSIVPPSETGPLVGCRYSDANGDYEFPYLSPSWYRVQETPPNGMIQTFPAGGQPHFIQVFSSVVGGKDFGNYPIPPGGISGITFEDTDQNGVQNGGEVGVSGVTICISPAYQCTTTGPGGAYSFASVPVGSTVVWELVPPGKVNTTPAYQTVTVVSNTVTTGVSFGNTTPPPPPPEVVVVDPSGTYSGVPTVYYQHSVQFRKDVTDHCEPGNNKPVAVKLVISFSEGGSPVAMMMTDMDGAGPNEVWSATFAPFYPNHGSASLKFYVDCPPDTAGFPEDIGLIAGEDEIQLGGNIYIDPSGQIVDVCNASAPISGVTVTLLKESPPGSGNYIVPSTQDHIPAVNPVTTGSDGRYGWTVVPGKYKVRAQKTGYITQDSTVVTIPPAVTDLNINLVCDTDGDGVGNPSDPCPSYPSFWTVPVGDADCDGFTSTAETTIGTNAADPCGFTVGSPTQSDTWPPDLVESNTINISDVLALKPVFNTAGTARLDIVPGGGINISDVLAIKPYFNKSCTP